MKKIKKDSKITSQGQNSRPLDSGRSMSVEELRAESERIYQEVLEESRRMALEENQEEA
jgi:hypothetical protein